MKYKRVAYFCDGRACDRQCADDPEAWAKHSCHHTTDESHAKNKCRRTRKFEVDKSGDRFEVE